LSSSIPPPEGPQGGPEYLERGSGYPLPPGATRPRNRKPLLIAGGAVALGLVGGGVWAATALLGTGAQPAEALPASTLGYASIDLDPSAAQKVEAFQMLRKFPAIKDELGLASGDDLRKKLFDAIQADAGCPDLGYRVDIEPWIGDRAAVAAVDTGADVPTPVLVLQVADADKADAGLTKIRSCATSAAGGSDIGGWAIRDGWAVIAETDELASTVADDAAESTLADDDDYQSWGSAVGDAGIVNLYAAPSAGQYLLDNFAELGVLGSSGASCAMADPDAGPPCDDTVDLPALPPREVSDALKDFKGMAATVRFDDGALELEAAGDPGKTQDGLQDTDAGDDVVATLPADTAAAVGFGFAEGWFTEFVDQMAATMPGKTSAEELMKQLGDESGLDLPGDAETLAGESVAVAVGSDLDPEAAFNSGGSDIPAAVKIKGDSEGIADVLDKVRKQAGPPAGFFLGSDSDGDLTAIGPDADYRAAVLEDGGLGGTAEFQGLVREAEKASAVLFVNFDAGDWLVDVAGGDQEAVANLEPLEGLGFSVWRKGDAAHASLRLTTN
jgi:hypothetical protein